MTHPRGHRLVITCEHGGCEVPRAFAALFSGRQALLDSHRGWDAGALDLARQMAGAFRVPLHAATTTRLLVDLNRSLGHRQLFSELTRVLPPARRRDIVDSLYGPHRSAIEADIARVVASGRRVIHVASHSFTPTLDGVPRRADVAWLYDPRRPGEVAFAQSWMRELAHLAPDLRLRRNYPYRGRGDGLTAVLRKRRPDVAYVGIELEVNQSIVAQPDTWDGLKAALIASLETVLASTSHR